MRDRDLYRGRRLDNGEWVKGYYAFEDTKHGILYDPNDNIKSLRWVTVDPPTVGQCTGLRDKNGTLIFEGDIVSYEGKNRAIQYMPKYAAYALSKIEYGLVLAWEYVDRMEIIGTIHTTPELMEGNDETN